jgi:hypothetical protein
MRYRAAMGIAITPEPRYTSLPIGRIEPGEEIEGTEERYDEDHAPCSYIKLADGRGWVWRPAFDPIKEVFEATA